MNNKSKIDLYSPPSYFLIHQSASKTHTHQQHAQDLRLYKNNKEGKGRTVKQIITLPQVLPSDHLRDLIIRVTHI